MPHLAKPLVSLFLLLLILVFYFAPWIVTTVFMVVLLIIGIGVASFEVPWQILIKATCVTIILLLMLGGIIPLPYVWLSTHKVLFGLSIFLSAVYAFVLIAIPVGLLEWLFSSFSEPTRSHH